MKERGRQEERRGEKRRGRKIRKSEWMAPGNDYIGRKEERKV